MLELPFLRGLVVIGRGGEDDVHARHCSNGLGFFDCLGSRVGSCASDDRNPAAGNFDGDLNHSQPLFAGERGSFAGGAAGHEEVNSRLDLPCNQGTQRWLIQRAIAPKGRDQRSAASMKPHKQKNSRDWMERT